MAARQMRVLAALASALAVVVLGLAGCAAASHPTANDVPRPASQTAAAARTSTGTATSAGTAVRLASPLLKCADPMAGGRAASGASGVRGTTGQARQMAAFAGSASPVPLATVGRVTLHQVGVVNLSQPGLVVLCGPVTGWCPPGFHRVFYPRDRSGRQPPARYRIVCIARFPLHSLPPEPRRTPLPAQTMPLHTLPPHTMPPQG